MIFPRPEVEEKLDALMDSFVDWSSCYEDGLTVMGVQKAMKDFSKFVLESKDFSMHHDRIIEALDRRNDRTGA